MEQIIIKTIDNELLKTNKQYLLTSQANKILLDKNIITEEERKKQLLKKLLENNKIPHAYQIKTTPKQWRIPLSNEGKKRQEKTSSNKTISKKVVSNTKTKTEETKPKTTEKRVFCPGCNLNLVVPKGILNDPQITCLNCYRTFINPYSPFKKNYNQYPNNDFNKWLRGVGVSILIIIIGSFIYGIVSDSDSLSTPNKHYYITKETFGATNKEVFREMYRYANDGDEIALQRLINNGQIIYLNKGTEVYLVKSDGLFRSIIRRSGSHQNLWVGAGDISRK